MEKNLVSRALFLDVYQLVFEKKRMVDSVKCVSRHRIHVRTDISQLGCAQYEL